MRKNLIKIGIAVTIIMMTACQSQSNNKKNEAMSEENRKNIEKITSGITNGDKNFEDDSLDESNSVDNLSEDNGNNDNNQLKKEISLAFTGDIYFSDNLYEAYEREGLNGFLSEKIIDNMKSVDLYIADHEYVASDGGTMVDYQLYTFRAPLIRENLWSEMGTDIITLANNHTLDYGVDALRDTMDKLNQLEIPYVGAGNNLDEAIKPCIKEVNGKKIAVFGASRFVPQGSWYATENNAGLMTSYESTPYYGYLLDAITEAKKECDYVIVYIHFGVEKSYNVAEFQKNIAHGYMDAGADLVVGTHPHVLEGIEFYNGKPIIYSMGNFLFANYHSDTMVLNAFIDEDNNTSLKIIPCSSQNYKTVDLEGEEARKLFDFIEEISFDITIDDDGNVKSK